MRAQPHGMVGAHAGGHEATTLERFFLRAPLVLRPFGRVAVTGWADCVVTS